MNKIYKNLTDILRISKLIPVRNKKLRIFYSVVLSNLVVFFDLLIIYFFTSFFEVVNVPQILNLDLLIEVEILLPLFIIGRFLIIYLDTMNIHSLRLNIEENLRIDLLKEVFLRGNLSIADSYFYLNTLSQHISQFYQTFSMLISSLVKVVAFSLFLIFTESEVLIYFGIGFLILSFPTRYFTSLNRRYSHTSYEYGQSISSDLERVLDNLYLIKILKKFKDEKKIFKNNLRTYYDSQLNNQKYGTINSLFPTFIAMILLSITLLLPNGKNLVTLDLIAILLRLFQSVGEFNKHLSMSSATFVHLENLEIIENNKLEVHSENFEISEKVKTENIIEIQNVRFKYLNSDKNIFENFNLEIKKGTHTIITGPNGVGKSTLLGLLSGIFYPQFGKVFSKTENYGYISAYPMIIRGTLKDNILYGNSNEINEDEIMNLIKKFELFSDINSEVLNLQVSNKVLSSGQMQKLSFIRALLADPDLLLLDESTSNLDSKSKKLIYSILNDLDITIVNSTHSSEELINYDIELKLSQPNEITIVEEIKL